MIPPPFTALLLPEIVVLTRVAVPPLKKHPAVAVAELLAIRLLIIVAPPNELFTPPVRPLAPLILFVMATPFKVRVPPNALAIPPPEFPTTEPPVITTVPKRL